MSETTTRTLPELLDQLEQGAESCFVRESVDGRTGNYSLAELPGQLAIKHTVRFIREHLERAQRERERQPELFDYAD